MEPVAIRWDGTLRVLDQTLLPAEERWIELAGAEDAAAAIRRLAVRGAPLIGIVAAYGLAVELARGTGAPPGTESLVFATGLMRRRRGVRAAGSPAAVLPLAEAAALLRGARPTAVNLAWAVDRVERAALAGGAAGARAEAEAIHAEEDAASAAIARHGADLLAGARTILTHCNTGALAAGGRGTAFAVLAELAERGPLHVLACETRPLLQGARLTAWELRRAGIVHELLVDGAAAGLIRRGEIDAVIVGCDRVAANGDVANKVGTYAHALAARAAGIPFVVAGPTSSIDPALADGDLIEIEERGAGEVLTAGGVTIAVPGTSVRNPAFDVTPAELVSALVTERGVAAPPGREAIAALLAAK